MIFHIEQAAMIKVVKDSDTNLNNLEKFFRIKTEITEIYELFRVFATFFGKVKTVFNII